MADRTARVAGETPTQQSGSGEGAANSVSQEGEFGRVTRGGYGVGMLDWTGNGQAIGQQN